MTTLTTYYNSLLDTQMISHNDYTYCLLQQSLLDTQMISHNDYTYCLLQQSLLYTQMISHNDYTYCLLHASQTPLANVKWLYLIRIIVCNIPNDSPYKDSTEKEHTLISMYV